MELRQLEYFVAVAEELHFARAAVRLTLAPSPLSRQIRGLERELGVQLLERNTRSVALTGAGEVFLSEAYRVLAQLERATSMAQQAQRGEVGALRVGFITSAAYHILPRLFQAYRERFPHVEIVPHHMTVSEQVQALQERRLHAGIVRQPVLAVPLTFEVLQEDPLVVALPCSHPLASCASLTLEALKGDRFVLLQRRNWPGLYDLCVSLCHRAGFSPAVTQEASDFATILGLVAAGIGVSLVPASAYQLHSEDIVCRPIEGEVSRVDVMLAWHPDEASPILRGFLSVARALQRTPS